MRSFIYLVVQETYVALIAKQRAQRFEFIAAGPLPSWERTRTFDRMRVRCRIVQLPVAAECASAGRRAAPKKVSSELSSSVSFSPVARSKSCGKQPLASQVGAITIGFGALSSYHGLRRLSRVLSLQPAPGCSPSTPNSPVDLN
jgi:hypothetical protein